MSIFRLSTRSPRASGQTFVPHSEIGSLHVLAKTVIRESLGGALDAATHADKEQRVSLRR